MQINSYLQNKNAKKFAEKCKIICNILIINAMTNYEKIQKISYFYRMIRNSKNYDIKTQKDLAEKIGVNQSSLSAAMNGVERYLTDSLLDKLSMTFPEIEQMYSASSSVITGNVTGNGNNFIAGNHNKVGSYAEIVEETHNDCPDDVCTVVQCTATLPYVKSEIVQSREVNIRELIEEHSHTLEHRSMRQLLGREVDYIQKVITSAMMPLFQPGDYLFVRFLPDDAKLISGAIYLIDTKAYGAMVRQVYVEGDELHLHSLNPEFKELEVPRDEVFSISLVVRSLRSDFNMPTEIPNITQIMQRRDDQIDHLIEQIDKASERESRLISLLEKKF